MIILDAIFLDHESSVCHVQGLQNATCAAKGRTLVLVGKSFGSLVGRGRGRIERRTLDRIVSDFHGYKAHSSCQL